MRLDSECFTNKTTERTFFVIGKVHDDQHITIFRLSVQDAGVLIKPYTKGLQKLVNF